MHVVHRRIDAEAGIAVVWLTDNTRPFVIVLIQTELTTNRFQASSVHPVLLTITNHLLVALAFLLPLLFLLLLLPPLLRLPKLQRGVERLLRSHL